MRMISQVPVRHASSYFIQFHEHEYNIKCKVKYIHIAILGISMLIHQQAWNYSVFQHLGKVWLNKNSIDLINSDFFHYISTYIHSVKRGQAITEKS